MRALLEKLIREEQGQDVIEYALLAGAISVIVVPVVPGIGTTVLGAYNRIQTAVNLIP